MHKNILRNKRNSILIMIGFVLFVTLIGAIVAYLNGSWATIIVFVVIAAIYALIQYFAAAKIAILMTGAHQIEKPDSPRFYQAVENVAKTAKLPMPQVYLITDPAPNAFATGRDPQHAVVAATTGLIEILNDKELAAVVAHELSHVRNYDIRLSMISFGLVCVIGFISDIGLRMLFRGRDNDRSPIAVLIALITILLAPIAAMMIQMALSRQREYLADSGAANLTHSADMIAALQKLEAHARPMHQQNIAAEALFIANPLRKSFISGMFSTHPPIEQRIERLNNASKK